MKSVLIQKTSSDLSISAPAVLQTNPGQTVGDYLYWGYQSVSNLTASASSFFGMLLHDPLSQSSDNVTKHDRAVDQSIHVSDIIDPSTEQQPPTSGQGISFSDLPALPPSPKSTGTKIGSQRNLRLPVLAFPPKPNASAESTDPYKLSGQFIVDNTYAQWIESLTRNRVRDPFDMIDKKSGDILGGFYDDTLSPVELYSIGSLRRYSNRFLRTHSTVTVDHELKPSYFVDVSRIGTKFFSSSAPVEVGFSNFFKFIYENVSVILMLTPLVENHRKKADQYVFGEPSDHFAGKYRTYGDLGVKSEIVETDPVNNIVVTKVMIKKITLEERRSRDLLSKTMTGSSDGSHDDEPESKDIDSKISVPDSPQGSTEVLPALEPVKPVISDPAERTVYHIHFSGWTDHHVPDHNEFCSVIKIYEKYLGLMQPQDTATLSDSTPQQYKPLIHCSAGIGRTGTWICIQYLLDAFAHPGPEKSILTTEVNLVDLILMLRDHRAGMIQTLVQFQFVYNFIRQHLIGCLTESVTH